MSGSEVTVSPHILQDSMVQQVMGQSVGPREPWLDGHFLLAWTAGHRPATLPCAWLPLRIPRLTPSGLRAEEFVRGVDYLSRPKRLRQALFLPRDSR